MFFDFVKTCMFGIYEYKTKNKQFKIVQTPKNWLNKSLKYFLTKIKLIILRKRY